jgi:hypothetical protein
MCECTRAEAVPFDAQLAVLQEVAYLRLLRSELDPLAISPSIQRIRRITDRQQSAIFDLLRMIDRLFPGSHALAPEEATT